MAPNATAPACEGASLAPAALLVCCMRLCPSNSGRRGRWGCGPHSARPWSATGRARAWRGRDGRGQNYGEEARPPGAWRFVARLTEGGAREPTVDPAPAQLPIMTLRKCRQHEKGVQVSRPLLQLQGYGSLHAPRVPPLPAQGSWARCAVPDG